MWPVWGLVVLLKGLNESKNSSLGTGTKAGAILGTFTAFRGRSGFGSPREIIRWAAKIHPPLTEMFIVPRQEILTCFTLAFGHESDNFVRRTMAMPSAFFTQTVSSNTNVTNPSISVTVPVDIIGGCSFKAECIINIKGFTLRWDASNCLKHLVLEGQGIFWGSVDCFVSMHPCDRRHVYKTHCLSPTFAAFESLRQ